MKWIPLWLLVSLTLPAAAKPVDPGATSLRWRTLAKELQGLEPSRDFPYAHCFRRAAQKHGMPLALLLAVARGESDFNPKAVSSAGALGLMQILWPGTARHLGIGKKHKLFDPCINVDAGARYLKELKQRYKGNLHLTLAAYNYGPGRIRAGAKQIPSGAAWYSGYILRHLDYVMSKSGHRGTHYKDEGRLEIIRFTRPYRAAAIVDSLNLAHPDLRLTVFRQPEGDFRVVLLFADEAERSKGLRILRARGLRPS